MIRKLLKLTVFCSLVVFSARSNGQSGCAVPAFVPPSCEAPSCVAPSCMAPCDINVGCAEQTHCCGVPCRFCGSNSGSASCQCCDSGKCRRPWINIDLSKTINKTVTKKNSWGGFGEAPPQGFAVSSMPVLPVNISAVPISFSSAASASSADSELASRLLETLLETRAASTAAAGTPDRCDDACGDIRQLQNDVKQLSDITRNLTLAVEELAKREKARETSTN